MKRRHILPASATAFIIISMAAILTAGGSSQPRLNPETGGAYYDEAASTDFPGHPEISDTTEEPADTEEPKPYSETDIEIIAKIVWAEARGVQTTAEKAAVVWCILNRYDAGTYGDSIEAVATAPGQFAYRKSSPAEPELKELALDVLERWQAEKDGESDAGRTLPADYLFFDGDGVANHFRQHYERTGGTWDWSLPSPYEEDGQ